MKKQFFLAAALVAVFGLTLFFAGCSNASDGGSSAASGNGYGLGSKYEKKLTIDLSAASDKLSAAGVASLSAGKDVSEWFSSKTVARSVANGFVDFKASIVSASETSLVIKVTATTPTIKCSIALSITIPANFTASGQPVVKENIETVNIGGEGSSQNAEILQTEHAKVEKVAGGLKFTITRPTEDAFNPNVVVKEEPFNGYKYVGDGKGSYNCTLENVGDGNGNLKDVYKYVGEGKGEFKLVGKSHYKEVNSPNGDYYRCFTEVEQGQGNCKFVYRFVGQGYGDYKLEDGTYTFVGNPNGDYHCSTPQYVGDGNGNLKYEYIAQPGAGYVFVYGCYVYTEELVDEYFYNKDIGGDYVRTLQDVGQGNGDYKEVYNYVGSGNGYYEYMDTLKTYGGWSQVTISASGGLSNGCVIATLDLSEGKEEVTAFWPLCESGKLCEYKVQIEPYDGRLRESIIQEKLVVAANDGIGEIEKAPKHDEIIVSYDGKKPTIKVEGLEPPVGKIQNLRTRCNFFATNQSELKDGAVDWGTDYAIPWFAGYDIPGAVDEFVWDSSKYWDSRAFNELFDERGKDTLYVTWHIVFDLPVETSGIYRWDFELWGKKNLLKIR